jgi:hypothetical protein
MSDDVTEMSEIVGLMPLSNSHGGAVVLTSAYRGVVDLTSVYRTLGRPHAPRGLISARKVHRGRRKCDVPGVFVNDPPEVWNLPDAILT